MNAPRKLYRSRSKKMVSGVCGGVAEYLNMDPTLVRLLTVVISLFTGVPILAYLIAIFVVPEEPMTGPSYPSVTPPRGDGVWGPGGAPWEQDQAPVNPRSEAPAPAPQDPPTDQPNNDLR